MAKPVKPRRFLSRHHATPRAQELPDYALFRTLPGAGAALAPRLLVAFGERRERVCCRATCLERARAVWMMGITQAARAVSAA
jgi:hypothetical protein